ncbi:MAG: PEP-CTERM sorting domain-containing protein [Xenococcaceae cyanobacterium]
MSKNFFKKAFGSSVATLGLLLLFPESSIAASFELQHTLLNPNPSPRAFFGNSISVSGNKLLIGTPDEGGNGSRSGDAYLFDVNSGDLLRTFVTPVPLPDSIDDQFGVSVAIDGDNVLIGARNDDSAGTDTGAAYLFDVNGNLLQTFLNPAPNFNDNFGESVAISGNNVLVGATDDDTGAINSGAAYLFDATTGGLLKTFLNPSVDPGDAFGGTIAIEGNNVLIGATRDDTSAPNAGIAYLFDAITGDRLETFFNPTPSNNEGFGSSIAVDGNNVLIGSAASDVASRSGIAYLFDINDGNNPLQTFFNPTPATDDFFSTGGGEPVAIKGDKILIGARADDLGATNNGAAYLYDTAGNLLQTFPNPETNNGARFGHAVAIVENTLVVTADYGDANFPNDIGGRAYIYQAKSVPEPSTLFGFGLILGLGALSVKRKQKESVKK